MSHTEKLESHLIRMGMPYEQLGDGTWVLRPDAARAAQIGVKIEEPIVLFSAPVLDLGPRTRDRESLFRRLLQLNSELLYSSYALEGEHVVLSGAYQLENLDFNEFQGMIDDMSMALYEHYERLSPWADSPEPGTTKGDA